MELEEYSQDRQFISEYQLNTEPLRIDVVIIKKSRDIAIKKNIAKIFRKVNIIEYKSPDDYVSVNDFYLVYGYACLYMVLNKADIRDLTLTFVESRHPRELFSHLQEIRGCTIEKTGSGIYSIKGDILPIQIIDSRELSVEENNWLKDLDNKLGTSEIRRVRDTIFQQGKDARIKAYLNAIVRANKESVMEAIKMSDYGPITGVEAFDEILVESGYMEDLVARLEAKLEAELLMEIARNMLKEGLSEDQTARLSGLELDKVKALFDS
jgi:hypothetical protein